MPWGICAVVSYADGKGSVMVSKKNNAAYAYVSNLFVPQDKQRQGRGTELMKAAEYVALTSFLTKIIELDAYADSFVHEWYKRMNYRDLSTDEENYVNMIKIL